MYRYTYTCTYTGCPSFFFIQNFTNNYSTQVNIQFQNVDEI